MGAPTLSPILPGSEECQSVLGAHSFIFCCPHPLPKFGVLPEGPSLPPLSTPSPSSLDPLALEVTRGHPGPPDLPMKGLSPQPLWLQGLFLVLGHIPPLQRTDGQIVARQDFSHHLPPAPHQALTLVIFNQKGELSTRGEGHLLLQTRGLSLASQPRAPLLLSSLACPHMAPGWEQLPTLSGPGVPWCWGLAAGARMPREGLLCLGP